MTTSTAYFTAPGQFWRGNLHTHSTLSDGALVPAEVCRRYKAEGYDFIALTDHFIGMYGYPLADTIPFRDKDFTTLFGAELHSGAMENGELWHILAAGLPLDFASAGTDETGPDLAKRAMAAGGFVGIAHPAWSRLTIEDGRALRFAHAVEIYNHGCAMGCDRADGFAVLDQLLAEGKKLNLVATDDAHFSEPDHFGGWVMVKSAANQPDALLEALKRGDFYSTTGPELRNVFITETEVHVEMSACVSMIVSGSGTAAKAVHGHSMTKAVLPLARFKNSPFIRVTVLDAAGKRAWSNPYYF